MVLPGNIYEAAKYNNIQKVLDWLGPPPVDKHRVNARNPDYLDFTLVFAAVASKKSDLLSILLQLGANVDSVAANGGTPLSGFSSNPEYYAQIKLLLEWGAEISNDATISRDEFIQYVLEQGNTKLANLLESEFGGRRCEVINLRNWPDLVDKTCVDSSHDQLTGGLQFRGARWNIFQRACGRF